MKSKTDCCALGVAGLMEATSNSSRGFWAMQARDTAKPNTRPLTRFMVLLYMARIRNQATISALLPDQRIPSKQMSSVSGSRQDAAGNALYLSIGVRRRPHNRRRMLPLAFCAYFPLLVIACRPAGPHLR